MPAHHGVHLIGDAHKNALNAVIALIQNEDMTQSENVSQPANASGGQNDVFTHWYGGRPYNDADLAVFQDLPNHIPAASWPVQGVSGSVTLAQAQAAAAALILTVKTQVNFTTDQARQTLAAALEAQGLQTINWSE